MPSEIDKLAEAGLMSWEAARSDPRRHFLRSALTGSDIELIDRSERPLVLEPGLRVYKVYNGYWFFGRPTVEELRLDLRAVLQRCRPDWDISSAEQRAAWAKGEKASPVGMVRRVRARPRRAWVSV